MARTGTDDGERAAVVATALDYYEGWFDGDADRMRRALHADLVKRDVVDGPVDTTTCAQMVDATAEGVGRRRDPGERRIEVHVHHVHGDIAAAVVTSAVYVDYLHLVRVDGRWQILNALWAWA